MFVELGEPRARGCLKECEHPFSQSDISEIAHVSLSHLEILRKSGTRAVVRGSTPKSCLDPRPSSSARAPLSEGKRPKG